MMVGCSLVPKHSLQHCKLTNHHLTSFSYTVHLSIQLQEDVATAERDAVRAEIKAAERELDRAVNAPVSGGRDPTEWLGDEVLVMIFLMLPFQMLRTGAVAQVCQRWATLMKSDVFNDGKRGKILEA